MRIRFFSPMSALTAIALCITALSTGASNDTSYHHLVRRGERALRRRNPAKAEAFFLRAYENNLPLDSLKYFWAQVYIQKESYDSALTMNYAIFKEHNPDFTWKMYTQRYDIYDHLGWQKERTALLDTLRTFPQYTRSFLRPDIMIKAGYTFSREHTRQSTYNDLHLLGDTTENRVYWFARLQSSRQFPFIGNTLLQTTLDGRISKPAILPDIVPAFDSLTIQGAAQVTVADILPDLSAGYTFDLSQGYDDTLFFSHTVGIDYTVISTKRVWFISLGGQYGKNVNRHNTNRSFWLINYVSPLEKKRLTLSFSGVVIGLTAAPLLTTQPMSCYYVDDTTGPAVRFYHDETFTEEYSGVDLFLGRVTGAYRNIFIAEEPQDRISVSLTPTAQFSPGKRFSLSLAPSYTLSLFTQTYRHTNAPALFFDSPWIALSQNDNRYYPVEALPSSEITHLTASFNNGAVYDPQDIVEYRRIDHAASLSTDASWELPYTVEVALFGKITRTYSSLDHLAFFETTPWEWSLGLSCTKKFKHRRFR